GDHLPGWIASGDTAQGGRGGGGSAEALRMERGGQSFQALGQPRSGAAEQPDPVEDLDSPLPNAGQVAHRVVLSQELEIRTSLGRGVAAAGNTDEVRLGRRHFFPSDGTAWCALGAQYVATPRQCDQLRIPVSACDWRIDPLE